jgi:hypothetical protein
MYIMLKRVWFAYVSNICPVVDYNNDEVFA